MRTADVRFGASGAALCVQTHLLEQTLAAGDPEVRERALRHLAARYGDGGGSPREQVRMAIVAGVAAGATNLEGIARLLAVHPRTLQRQLARERTSYAELLDEVRREVVMRHLTGSNLPMGQVALLAGFSEQAALNHAVRRWYGATPRQVRRAAQTASALGT